MSGDRLGVRWGLAGGVALTTIDQVREITRWGNNAGFDSLWISQSTAVDPTVALAAVASDITSMTEVGTSVVPLFGRHPVGLAQQVMTAQSALDGRFTLGIGPSHRPSVEGTLGLSWDRPFAYTSQFLDGLLPLLAGDEANAEGSEVTTRAQLTVDAAKTPVLLAALGPRMLALAGRRCQGTTVGQCGPKTIANHILPTISAAAETADRPAPRLMALVRICVTDEIDKAYALAKTIGAAYGALPSYAAMLAKEGVNDAADLHLIGSWDRVLDGLADYARAGVTDFRIEVVPHDLESRDATRSALADYLT